MRNRRVLISGAGIAGPTLAYWLLRHGFTPTLVEHAPAPRTGGYMIDFWGIGYNVADRMGLLPALHQDGYRLEEVRLVNASGKRVSGFDARVFQSASHGRFVSLLRGDLAHRIYELVEGKAETIFSDSIAGLEQDTTGVTVTFERAPPRRFDLVIGADGLHSNVRALAFGVGPEDETYLGYYAAAFSAAGYPHRDTGAYVSYSVPGRQVARYALRDGRSAFLFVFARDTKLAAAALHEDAEKALLREMFGGAGWECDEILEAMEHADDLYFDAVSQIRMAGWHRGRVALVGDAAYCPSLLAGQGSALAMTGAYMLAQEMATAEGDHAIAFSRYQRTFKPFVDEKQRSAARYGGWFAPRTVLGIRVRNILTNLMRLPWIGNLVAARSFADRITLRG